MSWFLIAVIAWAAVAVPLAVLLGRSISHADQVEAARAQPAVPDFVPQEWPARLTRSR